MPRPHAVPREQTQRTSSPFPALDLGLPITRPLSSLNVERGVKAFYDRLQSFLAFREGRAVTQPEMLHFVAMLVVRHANDAELRGFEAWFGPELRSDHAAGAPR